MTSKAEMAAEGVFLRAIALGKENQALAMLHKESKLDNNGDIPLHDSIFVAKGRFDSAELILSWPPLDLNLANQEGHPPLHYACLSNQPGIVERIIQRDKSLANAQKKDGFNPIHTCACSNNVQCMKILIEKGDAKVNVYSEDKQYPLHLAVYQGAFDCVKLLVQHGADVNGRDKLGNTSLHVAMGAMVEDTCDLDMLQILLGERRVTEETRTQLACFLVQHGADLQARNEDGEQALDTCPSSHTRVKEAVKKFIANNSAVTTKNKLSSSGGAESLDALCTRCNVQEAEILFVPCGHRVLCKECSSGVSHCPQCDQSVKQMFDKDGKKVKKSNVKRATQH